MTIRELSRLYFLEKLIERDTENLARLNACLQPGGMELDGMPRSPSHGNSLIEKAVIQISDIEERIRRQQREYIRERVKIEDYINSVEDYQIRLILLFRFVDLLTWQQVAQRIGGNNTEDSVRKACNRYLKRSEKQ